MKKSTLINFLDNFLKNDDYKDSSKNGLQVDNIKDNVQKIWYAVDATSYIIDKAIQKQVDIIIVHHGMYWGFEQTATGLHFQRLKKLIDNNICLYACHLPLDAHDEIGNNIWIVKKIIDSLDIKNYQIEKFWEYEWNTIWYGLNLSDSIDIDKIEEILTEQLWLNDNLYNFGNKNNIKSIAIISWWWGRICTEAKEKNYDLYITGEAVHFEITLAKEIKQSIFLGGHRETETFWVRLLSKYIQKKYNTEIVFLDEKY